MTALVWFTRDLRLHDQPALRAALERHERVVPVFCLDARLLHGRNASGPRTQFMLECLHDLDAALRERGGGGLVLRSGAPERELPELAAGVGADEVYCSADSGPFARGRAERVRAALDGVGAALRPRPGLHVIDDLHGLRTRGGGAYVVFSPFHRAWLEQPRRRVLGPPRSLPPLPPGVRKGRVPSLGELGLSSELDDPATGGEREARRKAGAFLRGGASGSSRLSPYLHFGCISPRELEARLPEGRGERFHRQLCWRDFYHQLLLHHPENARQEHQPRFRGMRWSDDREAFDAWRDGRTGYPLVDAGMRQLRREGWMHNRLRLVVGSFLTKDLAIDWRWGERHFMRWLIDGDEANNNGNWQWIASVGTDPQPAYRRIYNPARQQERLDPDGSYVRALVPELAAVPDEHLAEPWLMPLELQVELGCVIGRDYPEPIVDHAVARKDALSRYASVGGR